MDLQKWLWIDNLAWQEEWNTWLRLQGAASQEPGRLDREALHWRAKECRRSGPKVRSVYRYHVIPAMGTAVTDEVTAVIKSGKDPAQAVDDVYTKAKAEFDALVASAEGI